MQIEERAAITTLSFLALLEMTILIICTFAHPHIFTSKTSVTYRS